MAESQITTVSRVVIKFDDNGDASEASIGIYQYDATNNYKRINE